MIYVVPSKIPSSPLSFLRKLKGDEEF